MAFQPPHTTYYFIIESQQNENQTIETIARIHLNYVALDILRPHKFSAYQKKWSLQSQGNVRPFFVTTLRGNRLLCVAIIPPNIEHELVIVYSHTNGVDMGLLISTVWRLSRRIQCIIVMYDYSGYGLSSGRPSERNLFADIKAVVDHLIYEKQFHPKSIVLHGESIGSVPSIQMACRLSVGGVILQAAIASGLRAFCGLNYPENTLCFDPFPNIDRIDKVNCPVLVIHGLKDTTANVLHALALYEKCRHKVDPLFLKDGDHSNLRLFPNHFKTIYKFLKHVKEFHKR